MGAENRKTTKKPHFFLRFIYLLKSSLQAEKSTFPANFSPSPSSTVNLFACICYLGQATASRLVHTDLASIFNITTALHAGKQPQFLTAFVPFPTYFALVVLFSGRNFQNMPWQVEKFIQSRVPRLLRFVTDIFPDQRATGQIRQRSTTPNSLH